MDSASSALSCPVSRFHNSLPPTRSLISVQSSSPLAHSPTSASVSPRAVYTASAMPRRRQEKEAESQDDVNDVSGEHDSGSAEYMQALVSKLQGRGEKSKPSNARHRKIDSALSTITAPARELADLARKHADMLERLQTEAQASVAEATKQLATFDGSSVSQAQERAEVDLAAYCASLLKALQEQVVEGQQCTAALLDAVAAAETARCREHKKKMTEVRQAVASLLACQQASLVEQAKLAAVSALASLSHKSAM